MGTSSSFNENSGTILHFWGVKLFDFPALDTPGWPAPKAETWDLCGWMVGTFQEMKVDTSSGLMQVKVPGW